MMKRRLASRNPWPRIVEHRFIVQAIHQPDYTGYVTLLCLDKVREPLWVTYQEQQFCIVNDGYTWLQQFPISTHYAVTTQFDAQGKVVQWYIDICLQHGVNEMGVPWWDDLFLDVIVLPTGEYHILDAEELDVALHSGVIDQAQHQLAWSEANRLLWAIEHNHFSLLALSLIQRAALLAQLEG